MPDPRRTSLRLWLLALLLLPAVSLPEPSAPPPDRVPAYFHVHASTLTDLDPMGPEYPGFPGQID